jgi:hypothetical protein
MDLQGEILHQRGIPSANRLESTFNFLPTLALNGFNRS